MPEPSEEDWIQIETSFRLRWNFPNCCGAVDGKHITVRTTPRKVVVCSSTIKTTFLLFLMAVVDAGYRFIMVDVWQLWKQFRHWDMEEQYHWQKAHK